MKSRLRIPTRTTGTHSSKDSWTPKWESLILVSDVKPAVTSMRSVQATSDT